MRDRKIIYVLAAVAVVGFCITFLTGYLTGMNRSQQDLVSLAGGIVGKEDDSQTTDAKDMRALALNDDVVSVTTAAMGPKPGAEESGEEPPGEEPYALGEELAEDEDESGAADDVGADERMARGLEDTASEKADLSVSSEQSKSMDFAPIGPSVEMAGTESGPTPGSNKLQENAQSNNSSAQAVALTPVDSYEIEAEEYADGEPFDASSNPYRERLLELDVQIQKTRELQRSFAVSSNTNNILARNAASNESKLWDSELNSIYNVLLEYLSETQTEELISAQRDWLKVRDAAAVEAARKSAGGSLESVEYTASLAESTRTRAYELTDMYRNILIIAAEKGNSHD